jgi:hypothetical protein
MGEAEHVATVALDQNAESVAIARERLLDGDGVTVPSGLDALPHPLH